MIEILKKFIGFVIKYLTKKKFLYKLAGRLVLVSILTELGSFALPKELLPDYEMIQTTPFGSIKAIILSFFIGKFAGGYDWGSIGVKTFIFISCLIMEYKINASQGGEKSIFKFIVNNFNIGLFNKSETTINYCKEDEDI